MARETLDRLAVELSTVLSALDAAIPARFREPHHQGRRGRREATRHQRPSLRGVIAAVLPWLKRQRERFGG
jgi:hypothetical protein